MGTSTIVSLISIEEKNPLKQGLKQRCAGWCFYSKIKIEEKNPLKQGLKHGAPISIHWSSSPIEEKNPLKQGLKRFDRRYFSDDRYNWREESIKTRIETLYSTCFNFAVHYWREESIKTRIETFNSPTAKQNMKILKRRIH